MTDVNELSDEDFIMAYCHDLLKEFTENPSNDKYLQPASSIENAATNIGNIDDVGSADSSDFSD